MNETPLERASDSRALFAVAMTVFIDLLGFGIVISLLPIYSKAYGASEFELGLLFASFSLMQLIFAPFWGRLSDRIGRRPVLIGGLFGTAGSYVLFGFAASMPALFAARMLAGFFGANVSTAQAYIADVTAPKDRAKGMGLLGAAFGLGFTFGPLVGGELVGLHQAAPGLAAASLSLIAAFYGLARLPEPPHEHKGKARVLSFDSVGYAMRNSRVGIVLALYFMGILAFSGFETMFIRFGLARFPGAFGVEGVIANATMDEIFATAPIAGRYMFFIGLLAAFVQGGLIRRLVPRYGELKLIIVGPFMLGLGLALIGIAPSWGVVIAGCALMPFGLGLNNPSLTSLLSRAVPEEQQGAFLGLNQSLGSLARVLGPLVGAFSFQKLGPGSPFLVAAGVLGFATFLAVLYRRRHGHALG
jgi:MFS family permease